MVDGIAAELLAFIGTQVKPSGLIWPARFPAE
jgi:hypothetical protein